MATALLEESGLVYANVGTFFEDGAFDARASEGCRGDAPGTDETSKALGAG